MRFFQLLYAVFYITLILIIYLIEDPIQWWWGEDKISKKENYGAHFDFEEIVLRYV